MRRRGPNRIAIIFGIIIGVLLIVIGVLGWMYVQSMKKEVGNGQAIATRIQQEVGKIYMLPTGEEPTVARIEDKTKLGNQQFFSDAKNGDYLLLYKKKKLALIYREETKKLVNVGPINLSDENNQSSQTSDSSSTQPTDTTPTEQP